MIKYIEIRDKYYLGFSYNRVHLPFTVKTWINYPLKLIKIGKLTIAYGSR